MTLEPTPLNPGWVLGDRFEVQRVLGRGGFGIAYLAKDLSRGDLVVVKELAPVAVKRSPDGVLLIDQAGMSGHALRHRFLQEAEVLRKLHHPGIPALRAAFSENGTAYHVTGYLTGSVTLDARLARKGPVSEEEGREIFASLLDILEVVHAANVLHRDIKPSNILLGPQGEILLIDFGAAREWLASDANTHTVMHTPGYAPPEQLSERAMRGPGTDLYGLCATVYHALAGKPPPTAPDRMADIPLIPLRDLRPEIDPAFATAIERGLSIRLADRPDSVEAMRELLRDDAPTTIEQSLHRIDDILCRLQSFRYDRRACPACSGALHEPRPLKKFACPVCRGGIVRSRDLDPDECPSCGSGRLTTVANEGPLGICPACGTGRLAYRRKTLLSPVKVADCPNCQAHFEVDGEEMVSGDDRASFAEWRRRSGRAAVVKCCSDCSAQFDGMIDGRWRQTRPLGVESPLHYWEDWTLMAAGLPPGSGNAACDACKADFWREGDTLTLLDAGRDPFDFMSKYVGRALDAEDIRWLGIGKSSGEPGLLCDECDTEFDRDGEFLRLVHSRNRRLSLHLGEPRVLEDWHRIAEDLPTIDREESVRQSLTPMLLEAYRNGELSCDDVDTAWRGNAVRLSDETEANLTVTPEEVSFGGRFRRWRTPLDSVLEAYAEGDELVLHISGEPEPIVFEVVPLELVSHLRSGNYPVRVTAEDLAIRMSGAESEVYS